MPETEPAAREHSAAVDSGALTVAAAVAGLAAYAFVSLGTRHWGATAFSPMSVLWTLWIITSASLTFPLQHWTIKTVAVQGHEGAVRAMRRRLLWLLPPITFGLAVLLILVRNELFLVDDLAFPIAGAALVPASAMLGLVRGVLGARDRFRVLAVSIGLENIVRLLALLIVVSLDGPVPAASVALLAGFAIIACWPSALRMPTEAHDITGELGVVASLAGGQVAGQLLLAGPPVVLALLDGSRATVTAVFSVMALLRAPHLLAIGASPRLTDVLAHERLDGADGPRWVRRALWGGFLAGPLVALGIGPVVGWLLPLVFGETVSLSSRVVAIATGGGWIALLTLIASLVALAEGRSRRISAAWVIAIIAGAPVLALGDGGALTVVSWLAATEAVAFVLLMWSRPGQPTEDHQRAKGRSN